MNKRMIALAVAAAVAGPGVAMADESTVQIYGRLNVDFENVKADGGAAAALPSRNRVSSNSSNIGFKGTESLGQGLDAWFQVESGANMDAGGGTWANRNSAVGLKGAFGTVLLGQWDTPYKVSSGRIDPFGNTTIAAYTGILGGNSSATVANTAASRFSFDRRQQNTLQYWSPNVAGFTARVGYGANEEKTTSAAVPSLNPYSYSVLLAYDKGPIYAGYAHEAHRNFVASSSKDTGHKIFGLLKLSGFTFGLVGERLKFDDDVASVGTYKGTINAGAGGLRVDSWYGTFGWKGGPHNVNVAYGWDQKVRINGSTDSAAKARQGSVRYGFDMSKRTQLYAMVTKLDNKSASSNVFGNNALGAGAAGQDPKGLGVGMIHSF